jgi:hypothetical protein
VKAAVDARETKPITAADINWDSRDTVPIEAIFGPEHATGSYRQLAQQAIHLLHEQGAELKRLRQRYTGLLDEYRELRGVHVKRTAA